MLCNNQNQYLCAHVGIMAQVQQKRLSLGKCKDWPLRNKEVAMKQQKLVVLEVQHQDEAARCARMLNKFCAQRQGHTGTLSRPLLGQIHQEAHSGAKILQKLLR